MTSEDISRGRKTGVDVEHHETDLVCYMSFGGKPMELTEGWGNVEDGGVWMKSRVWKIDQNRVAVVKPSDD